MAKMRYNERQTGHRDSDFMGHCPLCGQELYFWVAYSFYNGQPICRACEKGKFIKPDDMRRG